MGPASVNGVSENCSVFRKTGGGKCPLPSPCGRPWAFTRTRWAIIREMNSNLPVKTWSTATIPILWRKCMTIRICYRRHCMRHTTLPKFTNVMRKKTLFGAMTKKGVWNPRESWGVLRSPTSFRESQGVPGSLKESQGVPQFFVDALLVVMLIFMKHIVLIL